MTQPHVAILGCGFAGPALALSLKNHGVNSTIYESRSESYTQGGNIALAPNALRVFDHVGIYDRIRAQGYNYSELSFDNSSGTSLGKFLNGSKALYNYEAVRIHRTIARDELRAQLASAGIEVKWNKKCTRVVEETDHHATIEFEDGETITADFVVGTDGIHSHVRTFFAPDATPEFSGLMGIMGHVDRSELSPEALQSVALPCMLFGASGSFAIMPASFDGSEIGYFATIEGDDRGRQGWAELGANKDELSEMLHARFVDVGNNATTTTTDSTTAARKSSGGRGHWNALVQSLVKQTPKATLSHWPFFSVPHLERWFSPLGRVVIIGDAAHAMALEDAETLAYTLARVVAVQGKTLDALGAWQAHRAERIAKVMDFTSKNGQLRKSSPHYYEQAAKEWLIWAMFKWMGEQGGAGWMYGYNCESVLSVLP